VRVCRRLRFETGHRALRFSLVLAMGDDLPVERDRALGYAGSSGGPPRLRSMLGAFVLGANGLYACIAAAKNGPRKQGLISTILGSHKYW